MTKPEAALGVILNKRKHHIPSWIYQLL